MTQELINFFGGETLPAEVWFKKYIRPGEITPNDALKNFASIFAKKEIERLKEKHYFTENDVCEIPESIFSNLTQQGKNHYTKYLNKTSKELLTYLTDLFYESFGDFKYTVLGGGCLQGLGANNYSSLSNCFVVGRVFDSYSGIIQKDHEIVQLMKRRGGAGLDLSGIRPSGAYVDNQARTSTGPVLFAERYSNSTKEVAINGRRGALMLSMFIKHPDIYNFIEAKLDNSKITGANCSVGILDDFMVKIEESLKTGTVQKYLLTFPVDGDFSNVDESTLNDNTFTENVEYIDKDGNKQTNGYCKLVDAYEYFDTIAYCAWKNGEPGILFIDRHWDQSPDSVYERYKGVTSNPCGEILMGEYDSCRLLALNLISFIDNIYTKDACINRELFIDKTYIQLLLGDILVDVELEYIQKIIDKIKLTSNEPEEYKELELKLWEKVYETGKKGRRVGSGFLALGDFAAGLNENYQSDEFLEILDCVFRLKYITDLKATTDLAILYGAFDGYDRDLEYENTGYSFIGKNKFFKDLYSICEDSLFAKMYINGRRNISWSTAAPTGSLAILTQTTSGIEPLFLPYYTRRKKCITENDRVDFTDVDGCDYTEYLVIHKPIKDWIKNNYPDVNIEEITLNEIETFFKLSPWYNACANDINYLRRLDIQATVQKYTTHSISSTINLPKESTKEDIANIYYESWKRNLKGVTVYRDGSRNGVLNSVEQADQQKGIILNERPEKLKAAVHLYNYRKNIFACVLGLHNEQLFELFLIDIDDKLESKFNSIKNFEIIKIENPDTDDILNKHIYKLIDSDTSELILDNIQIMENKDIKLTSLMVSALLRYNMPIKYIIKTLEKSLPIAGSHLSKISNILTKYISVDDIKELYSGEKCPDCGGNIHYENGCLICKDCGFSKCG